jgi:multimeric flavodoxin WrbA
LRRLPRRNGCVVDDDMQDLYPLLREAEGFLIATPVYNGGVSAQIKAVMDRTRALLASDPDSLRGKSGMTIAVGGDRAGGQELAIQQISTYYTINGMLTLSAGFFGANLGASFWSKDTLEGVKGDREGFWSQGKTLRRFAEHLTKGDVI